MAKLTAPGAWLGEAVAIDGEYIVAGDSYADVAAAYSAGMVYVYHYNGSNWVEEARLVAGDAQGREGLGSAVDIDGGTIIAGAMGGYSGNDAPGAAYIFNHDGGTWRESYKITPTDAAQCYSFGKSVGVSGGFTVAGADDKAYIHEIPATKAAISFTPEYAPTGVATLTWDTTYAETVTIEPGIGPVAADGTMPVTVTETTAFTLTAAGPLGVATASATLHYGYPPPVITASVTPEQIIAGAAATITWNTTDADSITIDDGIGTITANGTANGTIAVTPAATTTYTITAAGPGGSTSATVTVTVITPPTVTISADPLVLYSGHTVTLTWNAVDAASCAIEPAIGSVTPSGTMAITIEENTTFTITATNLAGTTTASVTVTFPPPSASFMTDKDLLPAGQSATLFWITTHADTVTIDKISGALPTSGTRTVAPGKTETYTLTATGPGGSTTRSLTIIGLDATGLGITIATPAAAGTTTVPKILVKGNVYTQADEVGVTVNGQPAQVQGGLWFANNLELRAGTNTITATATQPDGRTMTHTVTINLDTATPTDWIDLDVNPESGTAPLTTSLKVTRHIASFTPTDERISYAGPGAMTSAATEVDEYALTFATPGLYAIFYRAADGQGKEVTGEIMVNVVDKAAITVLLKARWDGMAAKLLAGDTEAALQYFVAAARDRYRNTFTALGSNKINVLFSNVRTPYLWEVGMAPF